MVLYMHSIIKVLFDTGLCSVLIYLVVHCKLLQIPGTFIVQYYNHIFLIQSIRMKKSNTKGIHFLNLLYNTAEWAIFLILCVLSLLFMWEVFHTYKKKNTSFKQSEQKITENPVFTICLPKFNTTDIEKILYHSIPLIDGENVIKKSQELVILEKVITFFSGICYKITTTFISKSDYMEIKLDFPNSTSYDQLPPSVDLYLTSNSNSQGIIYNDWKNGEELAMNFEKVCILEFYLITIMIMKHKMIL